jgi:hypothetical protein
VVDDEGLRRPGRLVTSLTAVSLQRVVGAAQLVKLLLSTAGA